MRRIVCVTVLAACTAPAPSTQTQPAMPPAMPPARVTRDSASSTLVPPNFGTLRQDDIAITFRPPGVLVTAIPLDESVIRLLSPDSYRALRSILESKRQQITQRSEMRGVREPRVWYVRYSGIEPDARFTPLDMTITSGGRDYRPFDIIPITGGFGAERLQARQTQSGLLLFEEGVDVNQSLVVTIGAVRNTDWNNDASTGILSKLDQERANVRARAAAAHP